MHSTAFGNGTATADECTNISTRHNCTVQMVTFKVTLYYNITGTSQTLIGWSGFHRRHFLREKKKIGVGVMIRKNRRQERHILMSCFKESTWSQSHFSVWTIGMCCPGPFMCLEFYEVDSLVDRKVTIWPSCFP